MTTQLASLETIEDFLAQKRIALAGISRDPKSFSVYLYDELSRRGYDIVPVNPNMADVKGKRCFPRVQDIQPPVDGVLVMTPSDATEAVVQDCAAAGIRRVWMHRSTGAGSVSEKALAFCREHGMEVVPGQCPLMFLRDGGVHRLHGFLRKITFSYPRRMKRKAS